MLSLTANGEVPVLWVDGGTVAVMPCSRSIRNRAQGGEALREARQTRLTRGHACRRLTEDACVCQTHDAATSSAPASCTTGTGRPWARRPTPF